MNDAVAGTGDFKEQAGRIINRNHHRCVFDTGFHAKATDMKLIPGLDGALRGEFPGYDFITDQPESVKIHNQLGPDDTVEGGLNELMIKEKAGLPKAVAKVSDIIGKINKIFVYSRIYANINPSDLGLLGEMREFAKTQYDALGGR